MKLWSDRRLRLSLTRLGAEYLACLLLTGLFAANTGNNLLYLIFSLMLGLLLVSGWLSMRALRGLELQAIEEGNLFARVKGGLRVRLKDTAPRRSRALELHLDLEQGRVEPGFLPGGEAGRQEHLVVVHLQAERRGWQPLKAMELRTRHPFGLLEKVLRFPLDQKLLVLPHPRTLAALPEGSGERPQASARPGATSALGARPYREGDALGRIHWKRTAQRGAPWVRLMEDESHQGVHLRLDLRHWVPGLDFEKELERLSGAVLQARLQKRPVSLSLEGRGGRQDFETHETAWKALALAQAEGRATASGADGACLPSGSLALS